MLNMLCDILGICRIENARELTSCAVILKQMQYEEEERRCKLDELVEEASSRGEKFASMVEFIGYRDKKEVEAYVYENRRNLKLLAEALEMALEIHALEHSECSAYGVRELWLKAMAKVAVAEAPAA